MKYTTGSGILIPRGKIAPGIMARNRKELR